MLTSFLLKKVKEHIFFSKLILPRPLLNRVIENHVFAVGPTGTLVSRCFLSHLEATEGGHVKARGVIDSALRRHFFKKLLFISSQQTSTGF